METIKLVIFDLDGTLRDSSAAVGEAFRRAMKRSSIPYELRDIDAYRLLGMGKYNDRRMFTRAVLAFSRSDEKISRVIEKTDAERLIDAIVYKNITPLDDALIEKLVTDYYSFFNSSDAQGLTKLCPGAEGYIDTLKEKYKVALFTNSSIVSVRRDITFLEKFDSVATIESVKAKKPSGEGILYVCKALGADPSNTVYIGDTVVDAMAARDAHCTSVVLLDGMGLEIHLKKENPSFMFRNLPEAVRFLSI